MNLSWHEYFMSLAILSSKRSKDPVTKVGACIVNSDNKIVSIGYNGFPIGCSDNEFPWTKSDNVLKNKHTYVVHAEANAILNSYSSLNNTILYVTLFPCNECAKLIIQSGIKTIYYMDMKQDKDIYLASKKMFDSSGVKYIKLENISVEVICEKKDC